MSNWIKEQGCLLDATRPMLPSPLSTQICNLIFKLECNHQSAEAMELSATKLQDSQAEMDVRNLKATKAEDAAILIQLWNDKVKAKLDLKGRGISQESFNKVLDGFHVLGLQYWKRCIAQGFWWWWQCNCTNRSKQGIPPGRKQ